MQTLLPAMLAAGLASGVHCVGMCGGVVAAFDSRPVIALRPVATATPAWGRRLAFNAGRLSTYALAGAVAGALGATAIASGALGTQTALHTLASVVLILIGLHLAGAGRLFDRIESLGAPLWRWLQPLAARLTQAADLPRSFAAGLVWGCLPCAFTYAALAVAAFAGGAWQGAAAMAVFGLGTLPFLLAAGWLARRLLRWRQAVGATVLGFGVYGLAHAGALGESLRRSLLCL